MKTKNETIFPHSCNKEGQGCFKQMNVEKSSRKIRKSKMKVSFPCGGLCPSDTTQLQNGFIKTIWVSTFFFSAFLSFVSCFPSLSFLPPSIPSSTVFTNHTLVKMVDITDWTWGLIYEKKSAVSTHLPLTLCHYSGPRKQSLHYSLHGMESPISSPFISISSLS